ncbi:MAG: hypothetical protein KY459_16445, partial [Acidobacteria bacterium]|nr:hypothetical protein [Acidobacteriota bacterium]
MRQRQPFLFLLILVTLVLTPGLEAATPASGSVSDTSPIVTWNGGPLPSTLSANCGGPDGTSCDNFKLEIIPPDYSFQVDIILVPQLADDWDLQVYGP